MGAAMRRAIAAVAWGIHDLIGGLASRGVGFVAIIFRVTVLGPVGPTLWLPHGPDLSLFHPCWHVSRSQKERRSLVMGHGLCPLISPT